MYKSLTIKVHQTWAVSNSSLFCFIQSQGIIMGRPAPSTLAQRVHQSHTRNIETCWGTSGRGASLWVTWRKLWRKGTTVRRTAGWRVEKLTCNTSQSYLHRCVCALTRFSTSRISWSPAHNPASQPVMGVRGRNGEWRRGKRSREGKSKSGRSAAGKLGAGLQWFRGAVLHRVRNTYQFFFWCQLI